MSTDMKNSIVLTTYYFEGKMAEARRWSAAWKKAAWKFRNKWQGDIRWVHAERNTNNQLRISNTRLKGERDEARDVERHLLKERDHFMELWEFVRSDRNRLFAIVDNLTDEIDQERRKLERCMESDHIQRGFRRDGFRIAREEYFRRIKAERQVVSMKRDLDEARETVETQTATIQHLESDRDALAAENGLMRECLEMVEWAYAYRRLYCAWCGFPKEGGHAPDCARQKALGLAK